MTNFAQQERAALCDDFLRLGPDAPTLCDPWLARDLAAHLVIRDSRLDLSLGNFIPALEDRMKEAMREYAARDWERLVKDVRNGPPSWSPQRIGPLDEMSNRGEFFIHHEDLLRAAPGYERRALSPELEDALWGSLKGMARLMLRRAPTGVVLVAPDHGREEVRKATKHGSVTLTGSPGELVLYLSGRQRVADVEVTGPPEAVEAMAAAEFGF